MKLLIVRHGDPDYEHDCLTEQGEREARLLAGDLSKMPIAAAYVSPLGRARQTARYALAGLGIQAEACDWLREFDPRIQKPNQDGLSIAWDWLPGEWTKEPDFFSIETWLDPAAMARSDTPEKYREVCGGIDAVLDRHGYRREGKLYRVRRANTDTVALFCHFGVESVILGHILNISPMLLWHGFCALPSSVTTLHTEERREGLASFRVCEYGALSHLHRAGAAPSFSGRFCECYGDGTRQD